MSTNENFLFLRSFMHNPKRVGSITPSSRFLANTMVRQAPWPEMRAVAELGSGTGAITRFINTQASETMKVLLFEMDEMMRNNLQAQYPGFSCHPNAAKLVQAMKQANIEQLDCIFSGLPFLACTCRERHQ
ncbi:class I SAM-dependent methyltransferase [Paenibacillus sp. BAC0078]